MINKLSMALNSRNTNNEEISTNVGYLNAALYGSTDTTAVDTFKTDARAFGVALNSLTNNTLMSIVLKSEEDISTAGE